MKDFSKYKLNTRPSPKDIRDWKVSAIHPKVALPEIVDYRPMMFSIRDQGNTNACAAFAGSAMKEWQEKIDVNINDYMSPQFIYNNRADLTEEGMYMRDLMEILKEKGVCPESIFPFGTKGLPSIDVLMSASPYKIQNYASVNNITEVKTALFLNGPCIIAFPVYNFTERFWYQYPGESILGGHAVTKVGYIKEGFIIRNSWGTDWGQKGYCIMPYEDFGLQWEIWSTIDAKSIIVPPIPPIPPEPEKKGCLSKIFGF